MRLNPLPHPLPLLSTCLALTISHHLRLQLLPLPLLALLQLRLQQQQLPQLQPLHQAVTSSTSISKPQHLLRIDHKPPKRISCHSFPLLHHLLRSPLKLRIRFSTTPLPTPIGEVELLLLRHLNRLHRHRRRYRKRVDGEVCKWTKVLGVRQHRHKLHLHNNSSSSSSNNRSILGETWVQIHGHRAGTTLGVWVDLALQLQRQRRRTTRTPLQTCGPR
jgi:hypothetical protein